MKKFNKINMLLAVSLIAFGLPHSYATPKLVSKDSVMSHWTLSLSSSYDNFHWDKLTLDELGYQGKLQYAFSKYGYVSGSVQRNADHKWAYDLTAGVIYPTSHFSPYLEVAYDFSKLSSNHLSTKLNYDAGLFWHMPKFILPKMSLFAEFDNFARNDNYMTYGLQYKLTNQLAIKGDFSYNKHEDCKEVKATISYNL